MASAMEKVKKAVRTVKNKDEARRIRDAVRKKRKKTQGKKTRKK